MEGEGGGYGLKKSGKVLPNQLSITDFESVYQTRRILLKMRLQIDQKVTPSKVFATSEH